MSLNWNVLIASEILVREDFICEIIPKISLKIYTKSRGISVTDVIRAMETYVNVIYLTTLRQTQFHLG
jgi:hypothetical protein